MSSGYIIQGSHAVDILSTNASEALTVGNTGLATTIRIYDCNAPLNGYLLTTSNNVFSITEANNTTPCVGIGTTTPNSTATLQVEGTLLTSNIGTYNTANTLYFNNTNLESINNINVRGTLNMIGNGGSTLTLGNRTGMQELILADIPTAQWKISTYGYNLNFFNDSIIGGTFNTNSRFYIYQNGAVGSFNNQLDDGSGSMSVLSNLTVGGYITTTTPNSGDNSTKVATTSYVQTAISGLSGGGGGGGGVTSSNTASTMPYLTSIGASNLTTSILGNAIVNSNATINGRLTAENFVCGSTCNSSLSYTFATKILAVNMNSNSYNTFKCNASGNIQVINTSNVIFGAQAIIYVTATASSTIYGASGSANLSGTPNPLASYTSVVLSTGNKAIITLTYDGTNTYINASQYS